MARQAIVSQPEVEQMLREQFSQTKADDEQSRAIIGAIFWIMRHIEEVERRQGAIINRLSGIEQRLGV